MVANPITVAADDTPVTAAMMLREHRLKSVPVVAGRNDRRLIGYLRAEKLLAIVLQKLGPATSTSGLAAGH
jgi:CBS domain-containing protein